MWLKCETRKIPFNGYLTDMTAYTYKDYIIIYSPDGLIHGWHNGIHKSDFASRFLGPHGAMNAFIQSVG